MEGGWYILFLDPGVVGAIVMDSAVMPLFHFLYRDGQALLLSSPSSSEATCCTSFQPTKGRNEQASKLRLRMSFWILLGSRRRPYGRDSRRCRCLKKTGLQRQPAWLQEQRDVSISLTSDPAIMLSSIMHGRLSSPSFCCCCRCCCCRPSTTGFLLSSNPKLLSLEGDTFAILFLDPGEMMRSFCNATPFRYIFWYHGRQAGTALQSSSEATVLPFHLPMH